MFAPATNNSGFNFLDDLSVAIERIGAAFVGAQQARRVYDRLSRLSAGELAARGMTRDDVTRLTLRALDSTSQY